MSYIDKVGYEPPDVGTETQTQASNKSRQALLPQSHFSSPPFVFLYWPTFYLSVPNFHIWEFPNFLLLISNLFPGGQRTCFTSLQSICIF